MDLCKRQAQLFLKFLATLTQTGKSRSLPATGPQKKTPHWHFVSTSAKYQEPNCVSLQLDSMSFYSYEIEINEYPDFPLLSTTAT